MATSYNSQLFAATGRAAKVYGVDAAELRKNFKNFKAAPKELKRPLLTAYKIMRGYKSSAKAVETVSE